MTSPQTATGTFTQAQLGTLTLIGWSGEHPHGGHDVAFLLAYSLGDGAEGPAVGEAAMRIALGRCGLPAGGAPVRADETPGLPVKLLVQAGQAVLTLPHFTAQYPVPPQWLAAATEQGEVHAMFATRPWPQGAPGLPVGEEELRLFAGDPDVIASSAHCVLPVRSLG
ncbi:MULTISPECIES: DUF5949 family protein [unclassified Streptomyces]|uniref:DUF5949 family protein n=1 Tax=unclassified Streptomyces TaxID=2593676 RepID=UPI002DDB6275|nr:DUF5949 family protein [Streptomyces sp. NBC_01022]MEE4494304.1 DUF5949 family protein [Streptomyces sp. BE230]WRZ85347.1 DUF5949 family protein [Streptomyces sp. NBC_01022]